MSSLNNGRSSSRALDVERWRGFQTQLLQCWLGEAIAHTAERTVAAAAVESVVLLALREEDDDAFGHIGSFARHFHSLRRVWRARSMKADCQLHDVPLELAVLSRNGMDDCTIDVFHKWLQLYHTQLETREQRACLLVLFAPHVPAATMRVIEQAIAQSSTTHDVHTLLLAITDPMALMSADASLTTSSSSVSLPSHRGFELFDSRRHGNSASTTHYVRSTLTRPLQQLSTQCGLRFVLEIARWTLFQDVASSTSGSRTKCPPLMLASVTHMPFQLLLQLLRWSHFHPILTQALARPFERKLQRIPQQRIRDAVAQLRHDEQAAWQLSSNSAVGHGDLDRHCDSLAAAATIAPTERDRLVTAELTPASTAIANPVPINCSAESSDVVAQRPLSECTLWDVQKQFYIAQGIRAWSDGIVPFGVSSSSFLAAAYARVAVEFFLDASCGVQTSGPEPNCFVWEAASGSCKFLHAFVTHFFDLVDELQLNERGIRPCVVASDLSADVLESRQVLPCFAPFVAARRLAFARFDTAAFTAGDATQTLTLEPSNLRWRVGSNGPVFVIGNYFLDSLRADVFAVAIAPAVAVPTTADNGSDRSKQQSSAATRARLDVHRGCVDDRVTSIADLELAFERVDPFATPIYADPFVNDLLLDVLDSVANAHTTTASATSSLVLFPVEAIAFLRTLVTPTVDNDDTIQPSYPIGVVFGDASFSYRDAISSAFVTHIDGDGTRLALPQLSPHPDCFCLPVDFAILQRVLIRLGQHAQVTACVQVAPSIANDTFDVLFATVLSRSSTPSPTLIATRQATADTVDLHRASHTAFAHEFASFTPSDCDLLYGLMGVDDGATHFSLETQIALLSQSAWDFDLFAVLQWPLLRCWREAKERQQIRISSDRRSAAVLQLRLVAIATRCWRTQYALEHDDALTLLQHCRWLYQLGAYTDVAALLTDAIAKDATLETNIGICYLHGLALGHTGDHWRALAWFRKCAAAAPTRLKYARRVAQTLRRLQLATLAEKAS